MVKAMVEVAAESERKLLTTILGKRESVSGRGFPSDQENDHPLTMCSLVQYLKKARWMHMN